MSASTPHSEREPCPVCLYNDWDLDYDYNGEDEIPQWRCSNCQWPPVYPSTVEEWRRQHFISPYLKDLEAMVADRDERIRSLIEQNQAVRLERVALEAQLEKQKELTQRWKRVWSEMHSARNREAERADGLLEQLEAARVAFHRIIVECNAHDQNGMANAVLHAHHIANEALGEGAPYPASEPDELCEDEWVPTYDEGERLLADMRVDRLEEIVRDGLGQRPRALPPDAPKYMRRENERLAKAYHALDELADRARGDSNQDTRSA